MLRDEADTYQNNCVETVPKRLSPVLKEHFETGTVFEDTSKDYST